MEDGEAAGEDVEESDDADIIIIGDDQQPKHILEGEEIFQICRQSQQEDNKDEDGLVAEIDENRDRLFRCHSINQEKGKEEGDSRDGDNELGDDTEDIMGEIERKKDPSDTARNLQCCHDVAASLDLGHQANYIVGLDTSPESEILKNKKTKQKKTDLNS